MKDKKKIGIAIRNNLQKIVIALISIIYIAQGLFQFYKKDTTLWNILGAVGISIIVGLLITNNMRSIGLSDGRKGEKFVNSEKVYGETKERATRFFHKLFAWCEYKNNQELEIVKKDIIMQAGLSWKGYKSGYYNEHTDKLTDEQKKALENVKFAKIERLTSRELLSDLSSTNNIFDKIFGQQKRFGDSIANFQLRTTLSDAFSRLFMAVVMGLYGVLPLFTGDNWATILGNMLWHFAQIILWLSFGVLKYNAAYSFMEDDYRQTHLIQKTEYLNEFIITMENTPEVVDNFDDEEDVDSYIDRLIKERENDKETNN